ncbi:unnamed protein product [Cuscuta campestris]|uniref:Uncharacterized protein n=1 Tax=Cuscuta campestris TaxID=132261 RepID=A0A484L6Q1_9ASTE|nr:unnamed protein product [Cuscuta campestris]
MAFPGSRATVLALTVAAAAVFSLIGASVAAEAPAPSPTSAAGSLSPSPAAASAAAALASLLFGSALRI